MQILVSKRPFYFTLVALCFSTDKILPFLLIIIKIYLFMFRLEPKCLQI